MRAIRQYEFGDPDTLRYEVVDDPEPGEGQVRLAVTVAGVQYRCASFELPGPVSGGGGHGSLCMWQADDLGFLITFRTSDPSAAFGDIRTVYDAIHGD